MRGGGKPGHVQPNLSDHRGGADDPETRDFNETLHGIPERVDHLLDRILELADIGTQRIDPTQHLRQ
jgi:hypothetical protein